MSSNATVSSKQNDKKRGEDGHVGNVAMSMRMCDKTVINILNRLDMVESSRKCRKINATSPRLHGHAISSGQPTTGGRTNREKNQPGVTKSYEKW